MMTIARTGTLGLLLALCLCAVPAGAQEFVRWVSATGNDDNKPCIFETPCRTFAGAQGSTPNGGIIMCKDSGNFGAAETGFLFQVQKSITIDCTGHDAWLDFIVVDGTDGFGTRVPNGPGIIVILRGLNIYGGFLRNIPGVQFTVGTALHIERCTITGFANSRVTPPAGVQFAPAGIRFAPEGESRLHVTDSVISGNGNSTGDPKNFGGGIIVKPTGSGSARVMLTRVQVHQNSFGISADGTASTGGIAMTITDSVSGGNLQDGIVAITKTGQAPIRLMLDRTRSLNNDTNGVRADGSNLTVRVDNSVISGNATGLSFSSGAALLTSGNNVVEGNAVNGAFSGRFALK